MAAGRVPGGFVDVPRNLYEAVCRAPGLTVAALKIILCIIRFTWGFFPEQNSGGARISRRALARNTGLHTDTVRELLRDLIREGVVERVRPSTPRLPPVLRVNPDPSAWGRHAPPQTPKSEGGQPIPSDGGRGVNRLPSQGSPPTPPFELPSSRLPTPQGASQSEEKDRPDGFAEFWAAYPLQDGESATRRVWAKLSAEDRASATAGARHYAAHVAGAGTRVQRPQNFIGERRFCDWVDGAPRGYATNASTRDDEPIRCAGCGAVLSADERASEDGSVTYGESGWIHAACLKVVGS